MQKITNGKYTAYCGDDVDLEWYREYLDEHKLWGQAYVSNDSHIYGNAKVYGNAEVYNNACVAGNVCVFDSARVSGRITVAGNAEIYGNTNVRGETPYESNLECENLYSKLSDEVRTKKGKQSE